MSKKMPPSHKDTPFFKKMKAMGEPAWLAYVTQVNGEAKKQAVIDLKTITKELFNWENKNEAEIALRPKCFIGCLALWNYGDIKQLNWTAYMLIKEPYVFDAIKKIRPVWISKYFNHIVGENFRTYEWVREYYTAGIISKPTSDNYIVGLISLPERLRYRHQDDKNNLYNYLVANRDVLSEDFWRIFQIQGTSDANMSGIEKYFGPSKWDETIAQLISDGIVDRGEVLRKTFDPLKNEWIQFRSGWFSRFHEFLAPTLKERKMLEDHYLSLLSNAIAPTKSFAIKALHQLSAANLLDSEKFLAQVEHVICSDKKYVVKTALAMLESILKHESGFGSVISRKIIQGLLLQDIDTQKKIANLLGQMPEHDAIIMAELSKYQACILPSMKGAFKNWLTKEEATVVSLPEETLASDDHVPPGIDPIVDPQELVYHMNRTLENPSDIVDIELIYQSALLIKDLKTEWLKPLQKRAEHWYNLSDGFSYSVGFLANFLLSWMNNFRYDIDYASKYEGFTMPQILLFQRERLNKYIAMKRDGKDYTPLSIPTHRPYFIDINSLIDRVLENQNVNQPIDEYDLIQAIARLDLSSTIDEQKFKSVSGELSALIKFMFHQGDYQPDKFKFAWLAAARTASPDAVLPIQSDYGSYYEIIDPVPLTWEVQIDNGPYHHDNIVISAPLKKTNTPPKKGLLNLFNRKDDHQMTGLKKKMIYPLQLMNKFDRLYSEYKTGMDIKWILSTTPNKQTAPYAHAASWIGSCASYSGVADAESKYFMEDLCLTSQPLDEMKCLAICTALGCSEKSVRAMATEALISAISRETIEYATIGKILDKLISSNYMRLNRLVAELKTVSTISKKHSKAVQSIILPSIVSTKPETIPKYFKKYLELLLELAIINETKDFKVHEQKALKKYVGVNNLKKVTQSICSLYWLKD